MACYLTKYVGTYRVKAFYDLRTNDFPRDKDGHLDPSFEDLYIDCAHGNMIMHHSSRGAQVILVAYCFSKKRGNNIIKELGDIVLSSEEDDAEITFYFNASDIDKVAKVMGAKTYGKDISAFSKRNLPKERYEINKTDMAVYRAIIDDIPANERIFISHWTNEFMVDYLQKTHQIEGATKLAQREKLVAKFYIHKHGYWNEYCEFLKKKMEEKYGKK